MTQNTILEKLAVYVADYVLSDHPLESLVGNDTEALIELQRLLKCSGVTLCEQAADKIGMGRLLENVKSATR